MYLYTNRNSSEVSCQSLRLAKIMLHLNPATVGNFLNCHIRLAKLTSL
jgi:hypothetical protein